MSAPATTGKARITVELLWHVEGSSVEDAMLTARQEVEAWMRRQRDDRIASWDVDEAEGDRWEQ